MLPLCATSWFPVLFAQLQYLALAALGWLVSNDKIYLPVNPYKSILSHCCLFLMYRKKFHWKKCNNTLLFTNWQQEKLNHLHWSIVVGQDYQLHPLLVECSSRCRRCTLVSTKVLWLGNPARFFLEFQLKSNLPDEEHSLKLTAWNFETLPQLAIF